MTLTDKIIEHIRDVPDFPKPGIIFKDITPIMLNPELCKEIVTYTANKLKSLNVDALAGIESRGFIFGPAVAFEMGVPFVMIRKKGKLPYETVSQTYDLEYGTAVIEMHIDAVKEGQRVLIHDDVLATGGTAAAAAELVKGQGGEIAGFDFLVDLTFLNGKENILPYSDNISNLVSF